MTLWMFQALEDGTITRVPYSFYARALDGHERLASPGAREIKMIECILEVSRRIVIEAHRILPARVPLTEDGLYDQLASGRQAMRRMELYHEPKVLGHAIARLEADASHFWVPSSRQWQMLADATALPLEKLRTASFIG